MGKCLRCGKESFLFKNFELKDGEICKKCFRALGFDKSYDLITGAYTYDEIKDGADEMFKKWQEKKKKEIAESIIPRVVMNTGERELNASEDELQIFDIISAMSKVFGRKPEDLRLVRPSDNYVSIKVDEYDLARFHLGERSSWIFFPSVEPYKERHKINSPEDVLQFENLVKESINTINSY